MAETKLSGEIREPAGKPDSLMVLCHGFGSNAQDLIGLEPSFRDAAPGAVFASPDAPEPCAGVPGGRQWFPLTNLSPEEIEAGADRARPVLDAYIDGLLEQYGLAPERLILSGFSQGTMMALHTGLRRKPVPMGILGYSGALAAPQRLISEMQGKPPVMLVHGAQDQVVPAYRLFEASGALTAAGIPVTWHVSPGTAHGIAPDGIEKGREFLQTLLSG